MKTARELFNELGFHKSKSDCYDERHIMYQKSLKEYCDIATVEFKDGYFVYTTAHNAPMKTYGQLLKAIYKQMEELGWFELES